MTNQAFNEIQYRAMLAMLDMPRMHPLISRRVHLFSGVLNFAALAGLVILFLIAND
jgi:hypothetical protein